MKPSYFEKQSTSYFALREPTDTQSSSLLHFSLYYTYSPTVHYAATEQKLGAFKNPQYALPGIFSFSPENLPEEDVQTQLEEICGGRQDLLPPSSALPTCHVSSEDRLTNARAARLFVEDATSLAILLAVRELKKTTFGELTELDIGGPSLLVLLAKLNSLRLLKFNQEGEITPTRQCEKILASIERHLGPKMLE